MDNSEFLDTETLGKLHDKLLVFEARTNYHKLCATL